MIQRKQSIYLLLAALLAVVLGLFGGQWMGEENILYINIAFFGSAILSLLSIFLFRNRSLQIKLGLLNIALNIFLVGFLAYSLSKLPGGFVPEKGIGLLSPLVLIGFVLIANRYIQKDEKLVKSVDRFR